MKCWTEFVLLIVLVPLVFGVDLFTEDNLDATSCSRCSQTPWDRTSCESCYNFVSNHDLNTQKRAYHKNAGKNDVMNAIRKRSAFLLCRCCVTMMDSDCCYHCGYPPYYGKRSRAAQFPLGNR